MSTIITSNDRVSINGVPFFKDHDKCIKNYEQIRWVTKALDSIKSFGTFFIYTLNKIGLSLCGVPKKMNKLSTDNPHRKKLVVYIHGLNNNPSQFKAIHDEVSKLKPQDTDFYIPLVEKRGNEELDVMAESILEKIKEWAKTGANKELVLVGISNGGRIAQAIESQMADDKESIQNIKKIRFVSIVGANRGSSLVDLANRLGLGFLLSKPIREEMGTESERTAQLEKQWKEAVIKTNDIARDYTFIASPHDWQVTNWDESSLLDYSDIEPEMRNHKKKFAIIGGHGHNSLANGAANVIAEIIVGSARTRGSLLTDEETI